MMHSRFVSKQWGKWLALGIALVLVSSCSGLMPAATAPETTPGESQTIPPSSTLPAPDAPGEATVAPDAPVTDTVETNAPDTSAPADANMQVAERVEFEPSVNMVTRSGSVTLAGEMQYAVAASEGQTLHVQTISPDAPVGFTVYGPGGMSWAGEFQPSEVYIFTTQFTAPEHGDYLVVLAVTEESGAILPPTMPESASYDVAFTVGSVVEPGDPQTDPVDRISFDPTTMMAERSGLLPSGPGSLQYLISANVDQTLTVDATSDGTPLSMTIESPSGNQWVPEMLTAPDGYTIGQQVTLPEPGYYLVTFNKDDHTPSTNYTVTFTLE